MSSVNLRDLNDETIRAIVIVRLKSAIGASLVVSPKILREMMDTPEFFQVFNSTGLWTEKVLNAELHKTD
jgi:hypothetical protein